MDFISNIWKNAREGHSRIVLPESLEPRTLKAADIILKENLAELIMIGDPQKILEAAEKENLSYVMEQKGLTIVNPLSHSRREDYAEMVTEIRRHKGMTFDKAMDLITDPLYLACAMIKAGDADGEVAGAENTTGDVLRPGFQLIKTLPGISLVSGVFIMMLKDKEFGDDGIMLFADCAVNPTPNDRELAEIAVCTADTARNLLGIEPRIAMLSFSTKGSASHILVDRVQKAVSRVHEMRPDILIDGEMQLDAAIVPEVAEKKCPTSPIKGRANTLIFPSLQAGNIAYKLVQRFAHADAFGPVLQGMAAPINDLSRGCFVMDIVNLVAITANQAYFAKRIVSES
jgi:phosphate acetyltransferase